jgi:hypothetical protein
VRRIAQDCSGALADYFCHRVMNFGGGGQKTAPIATTAASGNAGEVANPSQGGIHPARRAGLGSDVPEPQATMKYLAVF